MASRRLSSRALFLLFLIGFLTISIRADIFDADLDLQNYVRYEAKTGIDIVWQPSNQADPSETCSLYGYYDPVMLNSTDVVKQCFHELRSLVHSKFLNGELYYTNTYYYASDIYPSCVVVCLPSVISSSSPSAAVPIYRSEFMVFIFSVITSLSLVSAAA
ncbi:hypothetical protein MPTK2_4g05190 [Marchantia polymorpha subsp. ruderalis]